jgi:NAD(P)-dependent dehydrogenase (short-subunit alcohol dehydrogenase family)
MSDKKTAIVAGASGGIGAGLVEAFVKDGYKVVATSRNFNQSLIPSPTTASPSLVLVDGDIGKQETAAKTVEAAIKHFGTIDVLVNNAGIFRTQPFTDFTTQDFNALVSTNLLGFLYITQLAVKQMLKQKSGNVVSITAALVDQPVAGVKCLGFDDYEGRLERSDPESRNRVRKRRHPLQRRSPRRRRLATAQG